MLGQMYLATGNTMVEEAIARIRQYEPPEGYILAFSGGKDSVVVRDLTIKAGVKFETHYCRTGIDPPEHVQWMRKTFQDVIEIHPLMTMWDGIAKKGLPLRTRRWCCEKLKEHDGAGRLILQGVRWEESHGRSSRWAFVTPWNKKPHKTMVNPIVDWSHWDVWDYIHENDLPASPIYAEGWERIGCIMCPLSGLPKQQAEAERWPKIADAYRRAAQRYVDYMKAKGRNVFASGDDYFNWWLTGKKSEAGVTVEIQ